MTTSEDIIRKLNEAKTFNAIFKNPKSLDKQFKKVKTSKSTFDKTIVSADSKTQGEINVQYVVTADSVEAAKKEASKNVQGLKKIINSTDTTVSWVNDTKDFSVMKEDGKFYIGIKIYCKDKGK